MNKKIILLIIVVVLLIGLGIGGYVYWNKWKKSKTAIPTAPAVPAGTAEDITNSATKGTLPSIGTNPLQSKPNINPADKANPFKNVKTNPF